MESTHAAAIMRQLAICFFQVMSNSFGFGGVNASLLFGSPPLALDPVVDGTP